ncbi:MAG: SDR family oxidoreductase [Bacteroidia bacterium]
MARVWITGASSGIGRALALEYAKQGFDLIVSARNESALESLKQACAPAEVAVIPLDLSSPESIAAAATQALALGPIDILINNGGISQRSKAEETGLELDRRIMEINYFGQIQVTKAVLPSMLERGQGIIAVTTSLTGKWGFYLRSAYAASKHALHGFFDSLRMEVEDRGIQITLITPGFIATEISVHALGSDGKPSGEMDNNQAQGLPVGECARRMIAGIAAGKREFGVGGRELMGLWLRRFAPALFARLLKKQSAR